MTKVLVWCRHEGDNIIGIGKKIPWDLPDDKKMFRALVAEQNVILGRHTYETLTKASLLKSKVFVLTSNFKLKLLDKEKHEIVYDIRDFKDFDEDLYIAGGAKVYDLFMTAKPQVMPDIVVDSIYKGELQGVKGEKIQVSKSVDVLANKYYKLMSVEKSEDWQVDIYFKKGDFVDQAVLKSVIRVVEKV